MTSASDAASIRLVLHLLLLGTGAVLWIAAYQKEKAGVFRPASSFYWFSCGAFCIDVLAGDLILFFLPLYTGYKAYTLGKREPLTAEEYRAASESGAPMWLRKGDEAFSLGKYPRAIEFYNNVLLTEQGTAAMFHNLKLSYEAVGDPEKARECGQKERELSAASPGHPAEQPGE